jgi:hypothetical protein
MNHITYRSDLAFSYFRLLGPLKKYLSAKGFATDADGKQSVICWPQTLDTNFFYARIKASVPWRTIAEMSVVTTWSSVVYHLLHTYPVYFEARVKFSLSGC